MMLQKKCTILHGTFFLQRAVAERTETMGLIQDLAGIYEQSCIEYEQGRAETFRVIERFGADGGETQSRGLWAPCASLCPLPKVRSGRVSANRDP